MGFMRFQENKAMVGVVIALLLLFAVSVFFYNRTLNDLAAGSCTDAPGACPHEKIVETQNAIIGVLLLVIIAMVVFLAYQLYWAKADGGKPNAEAPSAKNARKVDASALDADEKKVLEIVQAGSGSVFQSEIIGKLGYSKVKISRVLDRMEQKGIVERKRRGMANLVVLK
jgi:hypothetical protein